MLKSLMIGSPAPFFSRSATNVWGELCDTYDFSFSVPHSAGTFPFHYLGFDPSPNPSLYQKRRDPQEREFIVRQSDQKRDLMPALKHSLQKCQAVIEHASHYWVSRSPSRLLLTSIACAYPPRLQRSGATLV